MLIKSFNHYSKNLSAIKDKVYSIDGKKFPSLMDEKNHAHIPVTYQGNLVFETILATTDGYINVFIGDNNPKLAPFTEFIEAPDLVKNIHKKSSIVSIKTYSRYYLSGTRYPYIAMEYSFKYPRILCINTLKITASDPALDLFLDSLKLPITEPNESILGNYNQAIDAINELSELRHFELFRIFAKAKLKKDITLNWYEPFLDEIKYSGYESTSVSHTPGINSIRSSVNSAAKLLDLFSTPNTHVKNIYSYSDTHPLCTRFNKIYKKLSDKLKR